MSKRILIIPAAHFQLSVIRYAKAQGYYVITCDNRTDNPGHSLADVSYNVSTTDKEAVLNVAQEERIDGVLAYASDPAAPTAAYVAEKMGLPGNPYEAVKVLARKSLYRAFLRDNGFNYPKFLKAGPHEKISDIESDIAERLAYPVMVKPVDRSGSKGVTKVTKNIHLPEAIASARGFSLSGDVIIEDYIDKKGPQIGGEAYVYNGEIEMLSLGEQQVAHSVGNPHIPVGMIFPARISSRLKERICSLLQRLIDKLNIRFGAMNLEVMIGPKDEVSVPDKK